MLADLRRGRGGRVSATAPCARREQSIHRKPWFIDACNANTHTHTGAQLYVEQTTLATTSNPRARSQARAQLTMSKCYIACHTSEPIHLPTLSIRHILFVMTWIDIFTESNGNDQRTMTYPCYFYRLSQSADKSRCIQGVCLKRELRDGWIFPTQHLLQLALLDPGVSVVRGFSVKLSCSCAPPAFCHPVCCGWGGHELAACYGLPGSAGLSAARPTLDATRMLDVAAEVNASATASEAASGRVLTPGRANTRPPLFANHSIPKSDRALPQPSRGPWRVGEGAPRRDPGSARGLRGSGIGGILWMQHLHLTNPSQTTAVFRINIWNTAVTLSLSLSVSLSVSLSLSL